MTIQYLQKLRDNNKMDGFTDEGLSLSEIAQLEQLCNNGNPFPRNWLAVEAHLRPCRKFKDGKKEERKRRCRKRVNANHQDI
jgi:hypothetical protein